MCSHEPWISQISNVANADGDPHPDFSSRLRTYDMDDDDPTYNWNDKGNITDYFTYDFTLEELLTLRRKQVAAVPILSVKFILLGCFISRLVITVTLGTTGNTALSHSRNISTCRGSSGLGFTLS